MVIKNVNLGGTSDWQETAYVDTNFSRDLNDTFDAAADKIKTLSSFWRNSFLYDIYDDFSGYSVGSFTTTTDWTISTSGTEAAVSIASSADTSIGNYLLLDVDISATGSESASATTQTLPTNKHVYARGSVYVLDFVSNVAVTARIKFGGTNIFNWVSPALGDDRMAIPSTPWNVFAIAKGNNLYDVYGNGELIAENLSSTNPELQFFVSGSEADQDIRLYVYDIKVAAAETSS